MSSDLNPGTQTRGPADQDAGERQSRLLIPRPSDRHDSNTRSAIYRLSELMFGSLLAAYVLGFIGATTRSSSESRDDLPLDVWLDHFIDRYSWLNEIETLGTADFVLISIAFSYITAASYVLYHAGILTLPQVPAKSLGTDFAIALSQAVLFGLSILTPRLFPLMISLVFLVALARQHFVAAAFRRRAVGIIDESLPGRSRSWTKRNRRRLGDLRKRVNDAMSEAVAKNTALRVWRPPQWYTWLGTVALFALAIYVGFVLTSNGVSAALNVAVFSICLVIGSSTLYRNADLLTAADPDVDHEDDEPQESMQKMDNEVKALQEKLDAILGDALSQRTANG